MFLWLDTHNQLFFCRSGHNLTDVDVFANRLFGLQKSELQKTLGFEQGVPGWTLDIGIII